MSPRPPSRRRAAPCPSARAAAAAQGLGRGRPSPQRARPSMPRTPPAHEVDNQFPPAIREIPDGAVRCGPTRSASAHVRGGFRSWSGCTARLSIPNETSFGLEGKSDSTRGRMASGGISAEAERQGSRRPGTDPSSATRRSCSSSRRSTRRRTFLGSSPISRRVLSLFPEGSRVIIVDDGSADGTAELAESHDGQITVEVVRMGRTRSRRRVPCRLRRCALPRRGRRGSARHHARGRHDEQPRLASRLMLGRLAPAPTSSSPRGRWSTSRRSAGF